MTEVYGTSDDLIEFEGDFRGEVGHYGADAVLVLLSDGTLLSVRYGKDDKGIWEVKLLERGSLFERIDPCTDEEARRYSDTAYFRDGIKWAYAAKDWERVA